MKSILISIVSMLLTSCASDNKSHHDSFWVGCMNAALYFSPNNINRPISERQQHLIYSKWCDAEYNKLNKKPPVERMSKSDQ